MVTKDTSIRGRGGSLQAAVDRAKGSKESDFGLETEPTPTIRPSAGVGPR